MDEAEFHGEGPQPPPGALSEAGGILWAAVVIPPERSQTVLIDVCEELLHPYAERHGVDELHFGDIYAGRKAFDNADVAERLEIVTAAADFLDQHQLEVRFRVLGPTEDPPAAAFPPGLNFRDRRIAALWPSLLLSVAPYVVAHRPSDDHRVAVYIDEWKSQWKSQESDRVHRFMETAVLGDPFLDNHVQLSSSRQVHALQLADFVASSFARVVRRVETEQRIFELDEQALRVLTRQGEGRVRRWVVVATDEDGNRQARMVSTADAIPEEAEPFPWDTRNA
jgi:hypothetical protein